MNKKKILLLTLLILPILIQNAKADVITTCEILQDAHVEKDNPTTNYGTSPNMQVNRNPNQRAYVQVNLTDCSVPLTNIGNVVYAEACFFTGTINRDMNTSIYLVNDSNNHFGGLNETTITWENQPCGNDFNNTANCSLTPLNITYLDFANTWYCYNVTDAVRTYWENNETNITFVITNTTTGIGGIDYLRSKEFLSTPADLPELNITYLIPTELNLTYPSLFPLNEYTLVQANYTELLTKNVVDNATCEFMGDAGNGIMTYNATSTQHEILVLPESAGVYSFTINCNAEEHSPQVENQSATAQYLAGTPYNFSLYLWENKNATTPYIDEFAFVVMASNDFNCTLLTGYNTCYFHARYKNGQANLTLYATGNYTIYFYSGELSFLTDLSPPRLHSLNDLLYLNDFIIEQNQTRLDLWIDVAQINLFRTLLSITSTFIIIILPILLGLGVALLLAYYKGGIGSALAGFLVTYFAITLLLNHFFGGTSDLTNLISLLIS